MPIYEYQCLDEALSCNKCRDAYEVLQQVSEPPAGTCPSCGAPVRRVVSRLGAASVPGAEAGSREESTIRDYEKKGMYSHAAELAEKVADKNKDSSLRSRAMDNYKKAGYDSATVDRHASKTETKS